MACTIVGELTGGSTHVGGGWTFSVTTVPVVGVQLDWTGDLGDDPQFFQDNHQLTTRWDTPGTKTVTVRCDSDTRTATVVVTPCMIVSLDTSFGYVAPSRPVLITADTIPQASVNNALPARKLE